MHWRTLHRSRSRMETTFYNSSEPTCPPLPPPKCPVGEGRNPSWPSARDDPDTARASLLRLAFLRLSLCPGTLSQHWDAGRINPVYHVVRAKDRRTNAVQKMKMITQHLKGHGSRVSFGRHQRASHHTQCQRTVSQVRHNLTVGIADRKRLGCRRESTHRTSQESMRCDHSLVHQRVSRHFKNPSQADTVPSTARPTLSTHTVRPMALYFR